MSPVRIPQISGSLEAYMVINFRAHELNQGVCKLVRTSMLIKKKYYLTLNKYQSTKYMMFQVVISFM
jgi:hypothetical protein